MVAAKKVALSGIRSKLQDVRCVCRSRGKALPTAIVKDVEVAREGVEMKRENTGLCDQNTQMEGKPVKARAEGSTMRGHLAGAERQKIAPETQLADAHLALENLAGEISRLKADLWVQSVAVEDSLSAERALTKSPECEVMRMSRRSISCWLCVERRVGQPVVTWLKVTYLFRIYRPI